MAHRFHLRAILAVLAALAFPSCGYQTNWVQVGTPTRGASVDAWNRSDAGGSGLRELSGGDQRLRKLLPDPRYRPPMGLWEIDDVASMVAKATGYKIRGCLTTHDDPHGPIARVKGSAEQGEIQVNPQAARRIPPNSWAFIIGHEFAHQIEQLGPHGGTTPERELRADIKGAEYARAAGFDLAAHLGWMFSKPPHGSRSHGDWHARAEATARHFGIPPREIRRQVERYRRAAGNSGLQSRVLRSKLHACSGNAMRNSG